MCIKHLPCNEIRTRCGKVKVVITCNIETDIEFQIVNPGYVCHPFLIWEHPWSLYSWEYTPHGIEQIQAVSLVSETWRSLCREACRKIILTGIIVVGLSVPCYFTALVISSVCRFHGKTAWHHRNFVITGIIGFLCIQLIIVAQITHSSENIDSMCSVTVVPVHTGIALYVYLPCCHRTELVVEIFCQWNWRFLEPWCSVDRQIIVLIGIYQREVEVFAQRQILVELVSRSDGEHHKTVSEMIAVFTVAILENTVRVDQRCSGTWVPILIEVGHFGQIVVGLWQETAQIAVGIVGVRRQERRLDKTKQTGRSDKRGANIVRSAVVKQVTVNITIGCVKTYGQSAHHIDVTVQTHIETAIVIAALGAVALTVSYWQVIVGNIVTTLHVDTVILHESVVIDFLGPVSVVVILLVIIVVRIVYEKVETWYVGGLVVKHLRRQQSVVLSSHHIGQLGQHLICAVDVHVYTCGHALVTLGVDKYHTVCPLCTVDGCSILEHGNVFNIVDVDIGQQIVVVSLMNHTAAILHVHHYPVDHDKRLCVGLKRVETIHKHGISKSQIATARDRTHVAAQALADKIVDAKIGRIVEISCNSLAAGFSCTGIVRPEWRRIKPSICICRICADGFLLDIVTIYNHGDGCHIIGHYQLVFTFIIGHCRIMVIAVGFYTHTGNRQSGGSIGHSTAHSDVSPVFWFCSGNYRTATYAEREQHRFSDILNEIVHICIVV